MQPAPEAKEIVVFSILRDSKCAECGDELWKGDFLTMEGGKPHCLACADLDRLVYLERGDVCLTRRSKKYSALSAVVVRFSRSRGRYERQGLLVEDAALKRAEEGCLEDAEQRAVQRAQAGIRRSAQDEQFTSEMAAELHKLFPHAPAHELAEIASHASVRGSGRVGRTAAAKTFDEGALTAAVIAAIRHRHTNYDELLMQGRDRLDARHKVRDQVEETLQRWRG